MKNMNDKTKKWLTVAGCLALCAVLVVLIGQQFITSKPVDTALPPQGSEVSNVTVDPKVPDGTEKEKEVTVIPPDTSQPTNIDNGAVSSGTEQTIQGDASKPEYAEEQLKDTTQKPNGEKVTEQDKPVDHDKVEKPKDTRKTTASRRAAKPRTVRFMCRVSGGLPIMAVAVKVLLAKVMVTSINRSATWIKQYIRIKVRLKYTVPFYFANRRTE